ncbi:MAG: hypothetical protein M1829_004143 [Trizodia sp. TS-e1964]|nr:MAG: hypothetical protein M1829_004143 [Trizodia sp. TS-e1964]
MEGILFVQPDRNAIIGRAVWKPRYVVLASDSAHQNSPLHQSRKTHTSRKQCNQMSHKASAANLRSTESMWLSVFKHKGDVEPISKHPLSSITTASIENLTNRKPGIVLPTLVLSLVHDEVDSTRAKRRSGQANSPFLTKPRPNDSILFRSSKEDPYSLYDWQTEIQKYLKPYQPSVESDSSYAEERPSSSLLRTGSSFLHGHFMSLNRNGSILSPSPSIRSNRSDISSRGSSTKPPSSFPSDLPSPTYSMPLTPLAEGMNPAMNVEVVQPSEYSSPHYPIRETILDRAFLLKSISGGATDGNDAHLSSTARFEALMQDMESKEHPSNRRKAVHLDHDFDPFEQADNDLGDIEDLDQIPSPAQRALTFIASGRRSPSVDQTPTKPGHLGRRQRPASISLNNSASFISSSSVSTEIREDRTRMSTSTTKRLSFTEFTRRLSSASSLLIQTGNSTGSDSKRNSGLSELNIRDPIDEESRTSHPLGKRHWRGSLSLGEAF